MKPIISYIILGVIGILILIRCLPLGSRRRKEFEILSKIENKGLFNLYKKNKKTYSFVMD